MAVESFQSALDKNLKLHAEMRRERSISVGMWADDPKDPGVTAIVCQGKLVDLTIPETYMRLNPQTLADIVNAVIANAFFEWSPSTQARNRN